MFITIFEKLLLYFDQAFINWNTSASLNAKLQQGEIKCGELFQNITAIHRADSFVLTSDSQFASIGILLYFVQVRK